jgi:hypothetical protein
MTPADPLTLDAERSPSAVTFVNNPCIGQRKTVDDCPASKSQPADYSPTRYPDMTVWSQTLTCRMALLPGAAATDGISWTVLGAWLLVGEPMASL